MKDYFLSLGSNIHPAENIPACIRRLKRIYPSARFSSVYETDPVGPAGPEKFWNLAAVVSTPEPEETLRRKLREIEKELGRVRSPQNRFLPRTIDIDVLPQPDYENQAFIIIPLAEIAPHAKDPASGIAFSELAGRLENASQGLRKLAD